MPLPSGLGSDSGRQPGGAEGLPSTGSGTARGSLQDQDPFPSLQWPLAHGSPGPALPRAGLPCPPAAGAAALGRPLPQPPGTKGTPAPPLPLLTTVRARQH